MVSPTLGLVARVIAQRLNIREDELRLGVNDDANAARLAFMWVADMVCEASRPSIALWLGLPPDATEAWLIEAEASRSNITTAEKLDEIALECIAEVMVRARKGGVERPDRPLDVIAQEMLRRNGIVSASEQRTLAAAWLGMVRAKNTTACDAEVMRAARAVAHARMRFNENQYTRGEAASRRALDAAVQALTLLPQLTIIQQGVPHGQKV